MRSRTVFDIMNLICERAGNQVYIGHTKACCVCYLQKGRFYKMLDELLKQWNNNIYKYTNRIFLILPLQCKNVNVHRKVQNGIHRIVDRQRHGFTVIRTWMFLVQNRIHFGIKARALFSKLLRDFNIHISSYPVSHHLWSAQTNNPYFKPPDEWSCQVSYFANKNVIYHNL